MHSASHLISHRHTERQIRNAEALNILLRVQERGAANDNIRRRDHTATVIIVLAWSVCIYLAYSLMDTALEPVFRWVMNAFGWSMP